MKRITFALLIFSVFSICYFASCSDGELRNDLSGNWELTNMEYVITPKQDFQFRNVFGQPWVGTINVNGEGMDVSKFNYGFDNVWGLEVLSSENIRFYPVHSTYMEIDYNNTTYKFDNTFVFSLTDGKFIAEGTAVANNGNKLPFSINLTLPLIQMQKDIEVSVMDGYHRYPYRTLEFGKSGKLQSDYLVGDIMNEIAGKWNISYNRLKIDTEYDKNDLYDFLVDENVLVLYRECKQNELPQYIGVSHDKIEKVVYRATYKRL